jgi:Ca2+-binding RTX toxin-like protein
MHKSASDAGNIGRPSYTTREQGDIAMAILTGTNGPNEIEGTRFADMIRGRGGNDELDGNRGDDTIDGGSGRDEIDGDAGRDVLFGRAGNDEIDGGSGNDVLYGGTGRDRLDGGSGNDRLSGGAGADIFEFDRGEGRDVVTDFQDGLDRVNFVDFNFRTARQALSHADQEGQDVLFDFGAGGTLRLADVDIHDLGAADFIL